MTAPNTSALGGALDTLTSASAALRSLLYLVEETTRSAAGEDIAFGVMELANPQFYRLEDVEASLRKAVDNAREAHYAASVAAVLEDPDTGIVPAGPIEAATGRRTFTDEQRRDARVKYIQLILRDTDYGFVAERYALPKETLRDILYGLIDAPQKVHAHTINAEPGRNAEASGMTPVRPIDFPEGVFEGRTDTPLAEIVRRADPAAIARATNIKQATVEKVMRRLLGGDADDDRQTGTDG